MEFPTQRWAGQFLSMNVDMSIEMESLLSDLYGMYVYLVIVHEIYTVYTTAINNLTVIYTARQFGKVTFGPQHCH